MVEVAEVESGLSCACVCPSCKHLLQANKGQVVSHYFSHDPSADTSACKSGFETSIHRMAKQILAENGYLVFPELSISASKLDKYGIEHTEEMQLEERLERSFERVTLEKRLGDIRPDIIAYINAEAIIIEVAVTSFVGKEKIQKIRNLKLSAIEIDLSHVSYETSKRELTAIIYAETTAMIWLSNLKAIDAKRDLEDKLDEKIRQIEEERSRQVDEKRSLQIGEDRSRNSEARQISIPLDARGSIHGNDYTDITSQRPGIGVNCDRRWFACLQCRGYFAIPIQDAPKSIQTVPCPRCNRAVSAQRRRA